MKKILYIIPYMLVCMCLLYIVYLNNNYNELNNYTNNVLVEYANIKQEYSTLENMLSIQNKEIEKYKLDISELTSNVNLRTNELEKEYELKTIQLLDELNKDSSDKNQLNVIGNMLYEFSKN